MVHLKRFQYTRSGWGGSKLDYNVKFEVEEWDVSPWLVEGSPDKHNGNSKYELYAISHHSGSLHLGHYTAYCRADDWMLYNDSSVSKASGAAAIQDSGAYILFYKRKSPDGG